jgi:hypothetical protein
MATISCSIESLKRTVTFPSSKLLESMVTQNGTQISSILAYLFPIVPTSSYSHTKSSESRENTCFARSQIFFTTGSTATLIGATFGANLRYVLAFSPSHSTV